MKWPTFNSASIVSALVAWLRASRLDLAIVVALTAIAAVPRLVLLDQIPPGLHGDEAWTGINARQILDEGWIGPYVGSALGYPSGPLYFAAVVIKLFGETLYSVRLSMALLGIVTIPLAYLTFRVMFDRTLAVFAGIFLAVGLWHLHFSRIAFPIISWPMMLLLTLFVFFLGIQTKRWLFYGLAGLALGAGIYSYNAHPVFIGALGLFILWLALWMALHRQRDELLRFGARVIFMGVMAIIAALPMILFAMDSDNNYFARHSGITVFDNEAWEQGDFLDRADVLIDGTRHFIKAAFWSGQPDGADGAGHKAMIDRVSLLLVILGLGIFLWRWRQPGSVAALLMVAILPFATIVTINGTFRQSIGIVPFLAALAAAPLALWWQQSGKLAPVLRNGSYAAIMAIVGLVAYLNLSFYFDDYRDTPIAQGTFSQAITDAALFVRDLPSDDFIYFYSGRWSYEYETRRYLAPDHRGEDRSAEFQGGRGAVRREFSLTPRDDADIAYVFLHPYLDQADVVAQLYPGGTLVEGGDSFRAYLLPRSVAPDLPSNAPKPTPVSQDALEQAEETARDILRIQDLATIRQALEGYRDAEGEYPNTGGFGQTLCTYVQLDTGCVLQNILGTIPHEPEGGPENDGYWYISNGSAYTLYAFRETDSFPACQEHPEFLERYESLHCIHGP